MKNYSMVRIGKRLCVQREQTRSVLKIRDPSAGNRKKSGDDTSVTERAGIDGPFAKLPKESQKASRDIQ